MSAKHTRAGLLLFLFFAVALASQIAAQDLTGEKIPRRVFFAPAQVDPGVALSSLRALPEFLYTEISARQPIVRVESAEQATTTVTVSVRMPGPSVEVRLTENGKEVAKVSFVSDNFADLAKYVEKASAELAPHLGFVAPVIKSAETSGSASLVQKVQLADRFARPIELSIDGIGLIRFQPGETPAGGEFGFDPMPVTLRFTYFPSRSLGFDGALLTYSGTRLSFGEWQSSPTPFPVTRALLILPGVGVKYRSLGTVFAAFAATVYAGYGYVTNITSQSLGQNNNGQFVPFLNAGASTSIFYTLIQFASNIGYNISPQLAVRAGISLNMSPTIFFNSGIFGYPTRGNSFYIQYLSLGFSYRP
ncbi:MAG TPA: hypothetical protein VMW69_15370 [Spirochaetia bacterium]|nr:hypothetical protein [Spirochaetia bacterium]